MLDAAKRGGRAVVIGGGLLGLEAAAGLKMQGMDVTVLHLMPTLMERQLDPAAGFLLEAEFKRRGIDVRTKANSHEILGDDAGKVRGIRLDDGTEIEASIIVMAVASARRPTLPGRSGWTSIAVCWLAMTCAPAMRTSSRSGNASNTVACVTGLSRRFMKWRV